jgi:REP element-mobilizing transposase RayT
MPRSARLDSPGILHHVIIRGIERRKIFWDDDDRQDLFERLADLLPKTRTACYAWAFLSNHAHFLLRSGPGGMATLMRRLLSGYAGKFNHRHKRHGQLFQNCYKSIVCQEDAYLKQLVAYIHLNPLRAKIVTVIDDLAGYPYCGHGSLVGIEPVPWQDTQYVLRQFGPTENEARRCYLEYVAKMAGQGRRPELVGGVVERRLSGWGQVGKIKRKGMKRAKGDRRILGDSGFIEKVVSDSRESFDTRYALQREGWDFERILQRAGAVCGVTPEQVLSGGRQRPGSMARALTCYWAVRRLGLPSIEMARRFGISTAAVSKAIERGESLAANKKINLDS